VAPRGDAKAERWRAEMAPEDTGWSGGGFAEVLARAESEPSSGAPGARGGRPGKLKGDLAVMRSGRGGMGGGGVGPARLPEELEVLLDVGRGGFSVLDGSESSGRVIAAATRRRVSGSAARMSARRAVRLASIALICAVMSATDAVWVFAEAELAAAA
jgi:hypothetical protein